MKPLSVDKYGRPYYRIEIGDLITPEIGCSGEIPAIVWEVIWITTWHSRDHSFPDILENEPIFHCFPRRGAFGEGAVTTMENWKLWKRREEVEAERVAEILMAESA